MRHDPSTAPHAAPSLAGPYPSRRRAGRIGLALFASTALILSACSGDDAADDEATNEELEAAQEEIDGLNEELAQAEEDLARTEEELATAQADVAARDQFISDLVEPFPVTVQPDLATANVTGQYTVALSEVRCFNLDSCGRPPGLPNVSLTRTADQLLFNVPGQFQIVLTGQSSQLFGDSVSQTLISACAGTPRPQSTRLSLHAAGGVVDIDGTGSLGAIGGSIIVSAPAFGDCPEAEVWYAATLTRVG